MTKFHSNDYIDFLRDVNPSNVADFQDQLMHFNVGEDCPVIEGLYDYVCTYASGSVGGARMLNEGDAEIAINWSGGLHHGKKHEASGFCYVNDCVLGILELLRSHQRVLYIDIDIHHGDGVEEAFWTTDRVMCLSFHKYGDYFPGTGALEDIGIGKGKGYSVNVPLSDGVDDDMFIYVFQQVSSLVRQYFDPNAVVLQCGADSLSGDRLGCFNLSLKGHGRAVDIIKSWGVPVLLLGGGGYTLRNVPKCWANETAIMLGEELSLEIPKTAAHLGYYGPDFSLQVRTSNMENKNTRRDVEHIIRTIAQNLREYVSPTSIQVQATSKLCKPAQILKVREEHPDERIDDSRDDLGGYDH